MKPVRKWGHGPYTVVVLHGGAGAPSEMATVARELSVVRGILEPFQTEKTFDRQVKELKDLLSSEATTPATLVVFSYGAVLGYFCAARFPEPIKNLILIGSPPFEEQYAGAISRVRFERLNDRQRAEAGSLRNMLMDPSSAANKNEALARLGDLMTVADACHLLPLDDEMLQYQYDIFQPVWDDVSRLRRSGALLRWATGSGVRFSRSMGIMILILQKV